MTDVARPSPKNQSLLLWTFVALACSARFVHLDSDPKFEYWLGYVVDEGRWVETARNLALFGDLRLYGLSKLHLVLSPLFQAINYVVFEFVGVNFWSARLWSAVCGAAIVIVTFLLLRRVTSGLPLFLGLAVVAFEPLSLSLSRTALPEIPSLLFTLLAFVAMCNAKRSGGMGFAGLLMALAIAMKGTTVLMVPAFVLMVALSDAGQPGQERLTRCAAFLLGLLLPAMSGIAVALVAGIVNAETVGGLWPTFRQTLALGSVYTMIDRFASPDTEYGIVNLLLLGAWLGSWTLIFRKEYQHTLLGKVYRLSAAWAAGWLLVWGSNGYTPGRYSCHVILPLAIHLSAGLGLWRVLGPARVLTSVAQLRSRWGFAFAIWLVVPAAVMASVLIVSLAGATGAPIERLSHKLLMMGVAVIAFAAVARAIRSPASAVNGFVALTVAAALPWTAIEQGVALTLERADAEQFLPLIAFAIIGSLAGFCLANSARVAGMLQRTSVKVSLCAVGVAGLLLQSAPVLLNPTYSIRDASVDIGHRFPNASLLQSSGAGAMLLETRLPYRDSIPPGTRVEGILNYNRHVRPGPEFVPEATYRLIVHPRFYYESRPLMDSGAALLEIYRNVQPSRRSSASP